MVSREPGYAEQTGVRVKRGDDHGAVDVAAATDRAGGGGRRVPEQDRRAVLEPRNAQRRIAVAHAAHDPRPRAFYQPVAGEIKRLDYGRYYSVENKTQSVKCTTARKLCVK